jgi:hypothetical protein
MLQARSTIVRGAVDIATSAVSALRVSGLLPPIRLLLRSFTAYRPHRPASTVQTNGIELDEPATTRLVSNLLTVICSESEVKPIIPLQ